MWKNVGVCADVCHCPLTHEVFDSESLEYSGASTERNRIADTLKNLFFPATNCKQGIALFRHLYVKRPHFLKLSHPYAQFISSLYTFHWVHDAKGRNPLKTQIWKRRPSSYLTAWIYTIIMSINICLYFTHFWCNELYFCHWVSGTLVWFFFFFLQCMLFFFTWKLLSKGRSKGQ